VPPVAPEREGPLVCFYGDDFTGSTDAAAQYRRVGLETVLLPSLRPAPELAEIAASVDVLGIAGISRSLPTEEMESELRPIFTAFAALRPAFVQYKICSTFDSSAAVGSFGRVCELACAAFGRQSIPVLAAQPEFGRYTLFGNHFARAHDGLAAPGHSDR
jgi:3-oxoisoapionate kinase